MFKLSKSILLIRLVGTLLAACASQPAATPIEGNPQGNNPYTPQPDEGTMMRGDAEIISVSVLIAELLSPPDFGLARVPATHSILPTSCEYQPTR
jgi:hypothetical protein